MRRHDAGLFPAALVLMSSRLDFSDLVEFSDVPELTTTSRFDDPAFAPVPHQAEDDVLPDAALAASDAPAAAGTVPEFGHRCLAKLIDAAVAGTLYIVVSSFFTSWFTAFFVGALAASAYLLLSDGLNLDFMRRRSLGKHLMKLNVARIDENPMDVVTSVRRNWMFAVGFFAQPFTYVFSPLSYLLMLAALGLVGYELYWVMTNPSGVRWGDDLAGTDVLKAVPVAAPTPFAEVLNLTPEEAM